MLARTRHYVPALALTLSFFLCGMALSTAEISAAQSKSIMIWLALAGLGLVLAWNRLPRDAALTALLVLCLVSLSNYLRWGPSLAKSVDDHDIFHYYLGAKYFEEVNNFDLYPALVAADAEGHHWTRFAGEQYWHTDPSGFQERPLSEALVHGREIQRTRFSPARWAEFKRDVYEMQTVSGAGRFRGVLVDKGFNATPFWVMYARPLAELVPVAWLKLLCLLDMLWLCGALIAVACAYGLESFLLTVFYLCVTTSLRWLTPGAAFLRYDWVASLVLAACLLRMSRHRLAGVFAGLAALLRYFPVVWGFGPASKFLFELFTPHPGESQRGGLRARIHGPLLRFGLAMAVTIALGQGLATTVLGTRAVAEHWAKINAHVSPEMISAKRPGFAVATTYDGKTSPARLSKERRARMAEQKPVRTLVALGLMLALAVGLRNKRDDEAYAFGYLPFFLLTTATYYYHVCRLTLLVVHGAELSRARNLVGIALLLGMEVWSNWVTTRYPANQVLWCGWLSWMILFYALLMIGWLLFEARGAETRMASAYEPRGPGSCGPAAPSKCHACEQAASRGACP